MASTDYILKMVSSTSVSNCLITTNYPPQEIYNIPFLKASTRTRLSIYFRFMDNPFLVFSSRQIKKDRLKDGYKNVVPLNLAYGKFLRSYYKS
jgi:hypothetical protein